MVRLRPNRDQRTSAITGLFKGSPAFHQRHFTLIAPATAPYTNGSVVVGWSSSKHVPKVDANNSPTEIIFGSSAYIFALVNGSLKSIISATSTFRGIGRSTFRGEITPLCSATCSDPSRCMERIFGTSFFVCTGTVVPFCFVLIGVIPGTLIFSAVSTPFSTCCCCG